MELVHTLLFFLREGREAEDTALAERCFKSLQKSEYKTVIVYNQGGWDNNRLADFLSPFSLDAVVIGDGKNAGILKGRQACFEYVWTNYPQAKFISELHMDMLFTPQWEVPLAEYLSEHDEPVISCGIIDAAGDLVFGEKKAGRVPEDDDEAEKFLLSHRSNMIMAGFTHPCVHNADILKAIGGIDTHILSGKQAFEDDSILLGYHYYYGTRMNWRPKVCFKSVVYHAVAVQRFGIGHNIMENLELLISQYGIMGLKKLSLLHSSEFQKRFFNEQFLRHMKQ